MKHPNVKFSPIDLFSKQFCETHRLAMTNYHKHRAAARRPSENLTYRRMASFFDSASYKEPAPHNRHFIVRRKTSVSRRISRVRAERWGRLGLADETLPRANHKQRHRENKSAMNALPFLTFRFSRVEEAEQAGIRRLRARPNAMR